MCKCIEHITDIDVAFAKRRRHCFITVRNRYDLCTRISICFSVPAVVCGSIYFATCWYRSSVWVHDMHIFFSFAYDSFDTIVQTFMKYPWKKFKSFHCSFDHIILLIFYYVISKPINAVFLIGNGN